MCNLILNTLYYSYNNMNYLITNVFYYNFYDKLDTTAIVEDNLTIVIVSKQIILDKAPFLA